MSYYQQQSPVVAPPPQGYPPEGYAPNDACSPPGYAQGYPQPPPPPQYVYGQPPPPEQEPGCLEGCLAGLVYCCCLDYFCCT